MITYRFFFQSCELVSKFGAFNVILKVYLRLLEGRETLPADQGAHFTLLRSPDIIQHAAQRLHCRFVEQPDAGVDRFSSVLVETIGVKIQRTCLWTDRKLGLIGLPNAPATSTQSCRHLIGISEHIWNTLHKNDVPEQ